MSTDDHAGHPTRTWLGFVIFGLLMMPELIREPLHAALALGGFAIVAGAVVTVVGSFRHLVVGRVPASLAGSASTTVRFATKTVTTYATYLVAFYTAIAVLVLFGVVGHFL